MTTPSMRLASRYSPVSGSESPSSIATTTSGDAPYNFHRASHARHLHRPHRLRDTNSRRCRFTPHSAQLYVSRLARRPKFMLFLPNRSISSDAAYGSLGLFGAVKTSKRLRTECLPPPVQVRRRGGRAISIRASNVDQDAVEKSEARLAPAARAGPLS